MIAHMPGAVAAEEIAKAGEKVAVRHHRYVLLWPLAQPCCKASRSVLHAMLIDLCLLCVDVDNTTCCCNQFPETGLLKQSSCCAITCSLPMQQGVQIRMRQQQLAHSAALGW